MKEKQLQVWGLVLDSLRHNMPVMLLYVLQSSGSSPGRRGFLMAVNSYGKIEGSIGGGIMEHKLAEKAKSMLLRDEKANFLCKQIHDKSAAKHQSGMICSGEQTVWLYRPDKKEIHYIEQIITCLQQHKNGCLRLSPRGLFFTPHIAEQPCQFLYESDVEWSYEEKVGYGHTLHIIGGGHCALALSRLMSMMDFYICLYEERESLPSFAGNDYVHQKRVVGHYSELAGLIHAGSDQYVVVMTMGYRTDDVVIRALMHKEFSYFGVLGSGAKLAKLFNTYKEEGVSDAVLSRLTAPMGLPIYSQTPEEIAVSIAAQMIAVKNQPFHKQQPQRYS